jgi:hypothetical protein
MNYERLKTCDAIRRYDSAGRVVVLPTARAFAELHATKPAPLDEPAEWTKAPRRAWQPEPQSSRVLPWLYVSMFLVAAAWGVAWLI